METQKLLTWLNSTDSADRVFNIGQKDLLSISLDGRKTFDKTGSQG